MTSQKAQINRLVNYFWRTVGMKKIWLRTVVVLLTIGLLALMASSCASAKSIKIGAIFAVTGGASNLGAPEEKTAKMVVDKINKNGGINGQQVELIIKDSGGKTENALSFAKQLIEEDQVVAIIGPTTSGESMA